MLPTLLTNLSNRSIPPCLLHLLLRDLVRTNFDVASATKPHVFQMLFGCAPVSTVIDHLGDAVVGGPKAPRHAFQIIPLSLSEEARRPPPLLLQPLELAPILGAWWGWENQRQVVSEAPFHHDSCHVCHHTLDLFVLRVYEVKVFSRRFQTLIDVTRMWYTDRTFALLECHGQGVMADHSRRCELDLNAASPVVGITQQ